MALRTTVVEFSGVPVVHVGGELDGSTAPEFRTAIATVRMTDGDRVAVDLSEVCYIESVAIGALIEVHAFLEARGGRLAVACAPSDIARILQVSGLAQVVPVFDNVASAVAFLTKR